MKNIHFLFLFTLTLLSSCSSNPIKDVNSLEKIFPELEKYKIINFTNTKSCKEIEYYKSPLYILGCKHLMLGESYPYFVIPMGSKDQQILENLHSQLVKRNLHVSMV